MAITSPRGQLCIWTDINPTHETDFNQWYDREHMQERVALDGFQSARRFKAVHGDCPRPYLALYDTDNLAVFQAPSYRQAFQNQTPWSLQNFGRMAGTQRRVGSLEVEAGDGEGGALALFVLRQEIAGRFNAREAFKAALSRHGIVRGAVLRTDVALSTPVTEGARAPAADTLVSVEATSVVEALQCANELAALSDVPPGDVYAFQFLWRCNRRSV